MQIGNGSDDHVHGFGRNGLAPKRASDSGKLNSADKSVLRRFAASAVTSEVSQDFAVTHKSVVDSINQAFDDVFGRNASKFDPNRDEPLAAQFAEFAKEEFAGFRQARSDLTKDEAREMFEGLVKQALGVAENEAKIRLDGAGVGEAPRIAGNVLAPVVEAMDAFLEANGLDSDDDDTVVEIDVSL